MKIVCLICGSCLG